MSLLGLFIFPVCMMNHYFKLLKQQYAAVTTVTKSLCVIGDCLKVDQADSFQHVYFRSMARSRPYANGHHVQLEYSGWLLMGSMIITDHPGSIVGKMGKPGSEPRLTRPLSTSLTLAPVVESFKIMEGIMGKK